MNLLTRLLFLNTGSFVLCANSSLSAFYVLHYMRWFDGEALRRGIDKVLNTESSIWYVKTVKP